MTFLSWTGLGLAWLIAAGLFGPVRATEMARYNVVWDIEWEYGKVSAFKLRSPLPLSVNVRVHGESRIMTPERG